VIFTDGDYTYPAEYIPEMIKILEENPEIGMVCGNRFNSHFHLDWMRNMFYFGNRILALSHNMLNGVSMHDPLTGLRVIRWDALKNWTPRSKGFDIEVELNHHVEREGYGIAEIPIHYRRRLGEKKLRLRHGVTILKRIILESTY
jgi:dolichol-phosphate mannosyltransferase